LGAGEDVDSLKLQAHHTLPRTSRRREWTRRASSVRTRC
jgi:hypothetical protein